MQILLSAFWTNKHSLNAFTFFTKNMYSSKPSKITEFLERIAPTFPRICVLRLDLCIEQTEIWTCSLNENLWHLLSVTNWLVILQSIYLWVRRKHFQNLSETTDGKYLRTSMSPHWLLVKKNRAQPSTAEQYQNNYKTQQREENPKTTIGINYSWCTHTIVFCGRLWQAQKSSHQEVGGLTWNRLDEMIRSHQKGFIGKKTNFAMFGQISFSEKSVTSSLFKNSWSLLVQPGNETAPTGPFDVSACCCFAEVSSNLNATSAWTLFLWWLCSEGWVQQHR